MANCNLSHTEPSMPAHRNNVIASNILKDWEVQLVQSYATRIGDAAHEAGWAHFTESGMAGLISISLGYTHRGNPVPLGSVVVSMEEQGQCACSVRGFDGTTALPGPEYYSSISEALTNAWSYFEFMAIKTSQHKNRPWWSRIF